MRVAFLAAMIVAMGSTAAPAYSGDMAETSQQTVYFKDLDLSTEHGRVVLKRRIKRAAEAVCGMPDALELRWAPSFQQCVAKATDGAVAQLKRSDM